MKFIKQYKDLISFAIIVMLIILLFAKLRCGDGGKQKGNDTISDIIVETFEPLQGGDIRSNLVPDTVYYPKPYPVIVEKEVKEFYPVYYPKHIDTTAILKDYYSAKIYADTVGTKYGDIVVNDTISKNSVQGRSLYYDFQIPTVTRQITIREPKRTIMYAGAGVWGSDVSLLYGTEVNLSLKNKQDKIFSLKGMLDRQGNVVYGFGVSVPIRLKKR